MAAVSRAGVYADLYKFSTGLTRVAIDSIDEERSGKVIPEDHPPPRWIVGHLAFTHDWYILQAVLGGESVIPEELKPALNERGFGDIMGQAKPSWSEVKELYRNVCDSVIGRFAKCGDLMLDVPPHVELPENLKVRMPDRFHALRLQIVHDQLHMGQLRWC